MCAPPASASGVLQPLGHTSTPGTCGFPASATEVLRACGLWEGLSAEPPGAALGGRNSRSLADPTPVGDTMLPLGNSCCLLPAGKADKPPTFEEGRLSDASRLSAILFLGLYAHLRDSVTLSSSQGDTSPENKPHSKSKLLLLAN